MEILRCPLRGLSSNCPLTVTIALGHLTDVRLKEVSVRNKETAKQMWSRVLGIAGFSVQTCMLYDGLAHDRLCSTFPFSRQHLSAHPQESRLPSSANDQTDGGCTCVSGCTSCCCGICDGSTSASPFVGGIASARNPGKILSIRPALCAHSSFCSPVLLSPPSAGGGTRSPEECMTSTTFFKDSPASFFRQRCFRDSVIDTQDGMIKARHSQAFHARLA